MNNEYNEDEATVTVNIAGIKRTGKLELVHLTGFVDDEGDERNVGAELKLLFMHVHYITSKEDDAEFWVRLASAVYEHTREEKRHARAKELVLLDRDAALFKLRSIDEEKQLVSMRPPPDFSPMGVGIPEPERG